MALRHAPDPVAGRRGLDVGGGDWITIRHIPLFFQKLDMFVVSFNLDSRGGCTDHSSEKVQLFLVVSIPSDDLYLQLVLLHHLVTKPVQVFHRSGQKEVVDVRNDSKIPLPMGVDSIGDFALFEMHLLHVTLDNREPREWGVTGPVQRSY